MSSAIRHGWGRSLGDPKPRKRIKDRYVYVIFHDQNHACLFCTSGPVEAAHLLGGTMREDHIDALVPLCAQCHRAWHGQAYREEYGGKKITPELVRQRVARWIMSPDGERARWYLTARLGADASRVYVEKLMPIPADYVDVAQRIREFKLEYPEGSLQAWEPPRLMSVGDKTFIAYCAAAYRHPEDVRPGIGWAWEPVPGPTPFTKDSELMNAETSAWGRAIVALGFETKKIASANEVRNRQPASPEKAPEDVPGVFKAPEIPQSSEQREELGKIINRLEEIAPSVLREEDWATTLRCFTEAQFGKTESKTLSKSEMDSLIVYALDLAKTETPRMPG